MGPAVSMEAIAQRDERARLARQLRQAQRLAALGQLTGGIARDFSDMLTVMSSYASFIRETAAQGGPDDRWRAVREDIRQLEDVARQAATLTRQLLAFARTRAVAPQPLDINEVISGVRELIGHAVGENVRLAVSLDGQLGRVHADRGQIELMLVDLAVNARDAMPGGGTLIIETAGLQLDEAAAAGRPGLRPGAFARLTVRDTGRGIPGQLLGRVFEPFFTTKPEAAGLGLATVQGIVAEAGGQVGIDSEPGNGTAVTILLPMLRPAAPAPPPPAATAGGGATVLIVEDEANMREVTRRILTSGGYRTLTAANGEEAIQVAAGHRGPIDVLLTDVIMPQMPGSEVASRIRTRYPRIRVLFMSGYTRGFLDARENLGDVDLIEKPFTGPALLTKLREIAGTASA